MHGGFSICLTCRWPGTSRNVALRERLCGQRATETATRRKRTPSRSSSCLVLSCTADIEIELLLQVGDQQSVKETLVSVLQKHALRVALQIYTYWSALFWIVFVQLPHPGTNETQAAEFAFEGPKENCIIWQVTLPCIPRSSLPTHGCTSCSAIAGQHCLWIRSARSPIQIFISRVLDQSPIPSENI